jgi:Concanavalin A-like lectin/glucanases superfamily
MSRPEQWSLVDSRGEMAMMNSVIIAAPLLIAAIVMAVRFVGCGLDTMGTGTPESYNGTVSATSGLAGFWQLDDASGSATAADSVGGAPNGSYHPGASPGVAGLVCSYATDGSATAASFDGVKGYVSVGFDQKLNPPKFTVEALVKPSKIASSAVVSSDTGYQLILNGNGAFEAYVGQGGSFGASVVVNAGATTTNGPFYVAMTYDGTTLSLYVNPAASGGPSTLGSDMFQQGTPSYTPATSGELRIGASASGPASDFFAGTIQDVAVYNRALGFYEIVNHYATSVCGMSPYPGGPTNSGDMAVTGNLGGSGTLSLVGPPSFPTMSPATWPQQAAGSYTYNIPYWCTYLDVFLLGAGGGGAYGFPGNGGQAGSWKAVTLYRGSGAPPSGLIQIPATTGTIDIAVGSGGAAGTNTVGPGAGGPTTASAVGLSQRTAAGGAGGGSINSDGAAVNPPTETLNGTTETGGVIQIVGSGNGVAPGGGAAGGFVVNGGTGADGAVWIVARQ